MLSTIVRNRRKRNRNVINKIKDKEIMGINVTLPYKKSVIPFLSKTINDANEIILLIR